MANKPILNYKGVMSPDPSDATHVRKVCVPTLVDRNQTVDLEQAVAQAIDRGLIAGLKSSAAKSIADGIMIQLGELLNNGTGVIFGEFFAVRPYLTGTIADILSPLTAQNKLRVRFVPGAAYKLDVANFSFHNVTQSEEVPQILGAQAGDAGAPADTWSTNGVTLFGKNLQMDAGDKVEFYNCDGDAPVLKEYIPFEQFATSHITNNETSVVVPTECISQMALDLGTKAGFKVVRTITVEGVETTIESKMYVATKYTAA